jgi:hypothetical protein
MRAESKERQEAATAKAQAWRRNRTATLLEKYPHIEGIVFSPGGQTVSNAAILIGINGEPATLYNRGFAYAEQSTVISTRIDGRYTIPLIPHTTAYVAHQDGFCEVNLDEAKSPLAINLAPWGRIEGTVTLQGKIAPHQKMVLFDAVPYYFPYEVHLHLSFSTESDDQGRFAFDGVPPGKVNVCRLAANFISDEQVVEVAAGKTTICQHGFNGRVINGHLVTSDFSFVLDWKQGLKLTLMSESFFPQPPANEDANIWRTRYWHSTEGQKAFEASHHFATFVELNGDFHIEDVPPGTYRLDANLFEDGGHGPLFLGKILGQLEQDVVIPENHGDESAGPLDLGNFVVQMR